MSVPEKEDTMYQYIQPTTSKEHCLIYLIYIHFYQIIDAECVQNITPNS